MLRAMTASQGIAGDPLYVKWLAIRAIASDSWLAERLVFKGGSALEMLYMVTARSSIDLDFSIEGDFDPADLPAITGRLQNALSTSFGRHDLLVFDLQLEPKPNPISPDLAQFWGGYHVRFKAISRVLAEKLGDDVEAHRRNALAVGPGLRKTFLMDISRHETCPDKERHAVDGHSIYAYSPRLIVAEKLRAICQQMPAYRAIVRSRDGSPRARDFFDIVNLLEQFSLILDTPEFLRLVEMVFRAKRVPLELLWAVPETGEFHRSGFDSVLDTVPPGTSVRGFDEYFDGVVRLIRRLEALRDV